MYCPVSSVHYSPGRYLQHSHLSQAQYQLSEGSCLLLSTSTFTVWFGVTLVKDDVQRKQLVCQSSAGYLYSAVQRRVSTVQCSRVSTVSLSDCVSGTADAEWLSLYYEQSDYMLSTHSDSDICTHLVNVNNSARY